MVNTLQIKPAKEGALSEFKPLHPGRDELLNTLVSFEHAYVVKDGWTDIAHFGWEVFLPGCVEVWVVLGDRAQHQTKDLIKTFRKGLKTFTEQNPSYNRIQVVVEARHPDRRFVEVVGFRREGYLRAYLEGEDALMYSLTRKEALAL
jgi:hypothetical protein